VSFSHRINIKLVQFLRTYIPRDNVAYCKGQENGYEKDGLMRKMPAKVNSGDKKSVMQPTVTWRTWNVRQPNTAGDDSVTR